MGTVFSIVSPYRGICSCTVCQRNPDCNTEQGRRTLLKYTQHLLRRPDDVRIIEKYIEVPSGHVLFTKCFVPLKSKPKGCVFFVEGYACNLERPGVHENCLFFAENGYMCIAHDHLGYGRSDGLWLYIPNTFDVDYVDNAHFIHNYCKNIYIKHLSSREMHNELYKFRDPSLSNDSDTEDHADDTKQNGDGDDNEMIPWTDLSYIDEGNKYFLCGRSMGGGISTRLAMKYRDSYAGAMLLCPMIAIDDAVKPPPFVIWLFTKFAALFPTKPWAPAKDLNPHMVSTEQGKVEVDQGTMKWGRPPRLKTAVEILKVTEQIQNDMHLLKTDFIVLHGVEDRVTDCKMSKDLYDKRKDSCDASIKLYERSYHMLWAEPCGKEMYTVEFDRTNYRNFGVY